MAKSNQLGAATGIRDMQDRMDNGAPSFFDSLPLFTAFEGVTDGANYRPLPDDWALATADIVDSTGAIRDGRYKAVNMAGASVISAILNQVKRRDLPFVFGGDGALVAFPLSLMEEAKVALAAVQAWVADELALRIRAAIVPVADIRAAKLDVRVARFKVSDHASFAMFAGGGASWAEAQMKAGRFKVDTAPSGTWPNLTGLSCRWNPMDARRGQIVSVIAVPGSRRDAEAFSALVNEVVALAEQQDRGGHPVPARGPDYGFVPGGLDSEARASVQRGRFRQKLIILAQVWLVTLLSILRLKLGTFDPEVYRRDVADNSDFRKFDDGLKMTIDVAPAVADGIEARLRKAEADGICRFGMHRQDKALMTCMVATPLQRDHVHFIDGGAGGYAVAAANLKAGHAV